MMLHITSIYLEMRIVMQELKIREEDEFIKLGQAIKAAGLVESGVEAKLVIQDGQVETQRGKKLTGGEKVSYKGQEILIIR